METGVPLALSIGLLTPLPFWKLESGTAARTSAAPKLLTLPTK
jgi:hypothetical protein